MVNSRTIGSRGGGQSPLSSNDRLSFLELSNDDDNAAAADSNENEDEGDLFKSEGWEVIQKDLDQVPIFTCANKLGQPLAYTIEIKEESYKVPFFFCDVEDAEKELEKFKKSLGDNDLGLIPFPLGKAFRMWANDKAVIVPNKNAIQQAGAPPKTNPIGQQVPLFACMDLVQPDESGSGGVLPLFMVLEEANEALKQAVEMDGGNVDEFEVVSLSLSKAVDLLATVPETPAFQFIAPQKSLIYIQDYLS